MGARSSVIYDTGFAVCTKFERSISEDMGQAAMIRGVARAKSLVWPNPDDQNFRVAGHPK